LPETKKVILEIANFEAIGIRRTATRYEVRTEAAIRYEKGIDPERGDITLSLAMKMFEDFFPGMSVTGFHDNYPEAGKLKRSEIDVSLDWLERRLGKRIPNGDIGRILEHLGFEVNFAGDNMHVVTPTWRSTGDVSIPDDIMEEVARLYGFENFEPTPITTSFEASINQLELDMDRKIREYLASRCGMQEIFTYPWISDAYVSSILSNSDGMLSIFAPPSPDERYIRSSLLPNICKAVADNLRFFGEFAIFESAQVFFNRDFGTTYDSRESLPLQRRNAAGACVDNSENVNLLFRKAKGMIEALPRYVHIEPVGFEKIEKPVWADGVLWLNITHCGKQIGNLALLSKKAALDCGIKNSSVMLFELDIDSLKPYPSRTNKFIHIPEYPMTNYDMSLLFDLPVKWDEIMGVITGINDSSDLLRSVSFVDEYRGHQVPEGKKSITFRLVIGSLKKTLASDDIESCASAVVGRLNKTFGAILRS
jgi:phenylalanyl-tRNA synthetase beta chain